MGCGHVDGPLGVFASRAWHDMLARIWHLDATGDIAGSLQGDEELPDLTAQWRYTGDWGHVQAAGILRRVGFETAGTPNNEPSDSKVGWGINLTSNIKVFEKDVIHLGAVYGEGIASYMNDGGVDLAPSSSLSAETVQSIGWLAYYNHWWADQWSRFYRRWSTWRSCTWQ